MLDAFTDEYATFWPVERELLAVIAELLHVLVTVTLKANGAKRTPPPLHIPRPHGVGETKRAPISITEYVASITKQP